MTTTIIETVTSTTPTITFTDVWLRDVVLVGVKLFDDGSNLAAVNGPEGWDFAYYTGTESAWWNQLQAGETTWTFDVTHAASMQLLGLHLRSDLPGSTDTAITRSVDNGGSFVTVGIDDTILAYSFVRDQPIDITGVDFTLIDQTSHVAAWRHEPLQVAAGTTITVISASNTPSAAFAFRRWSAGPPPEPAGATPWTLWMVD